MATIEDFKGIMLNIGIEEGLVRELKPAQPIAGRLMDSVDYPAFLAAVEERFGVRIEDRYALKLKSLNDFMNYVNEGETAR